MIDFDEKKLLKKPTSCMHCVVNLKRLLIKSAKRDLTIFCLLPQVDLWQHLNHLPI